MKRIIFLVCFLLVAATAHARFWVSVSDVSKQKTFTPLATYDFEDGTFQGWSDVQGDVQGITTVSASGAIEGSYGVAFEWPIQDDDVLYIWKDISAIAGANAVRFKVDISNLTKSYGKGYACLFAIGDTRYSPVVRVRFDWDVGNPAITNTIDSQSVEIDSSVSHEVLIEVSGGVDGYISVYIDGEFQYKSTGDLSSQSLTLVSLGAQDRYGQFDAGSLYKIDSVEIGRYE